ncbi:hypothetical protein ACTU6U_12355 [Microbacterium sp. A196]|uniref:hypothetical protein n=1 Tax=Microbacterium sp. A196 TaxID=3457320 RepID=UPI003FCFE056
MNAGARANDRMRTGPAVPGAVLQLLLVVVAAGGAVLLIPVAGWQFIVVGTALLGMLFPQSLGGWLSILCLAIGMLMADPGIWQAMVAVAVAHIMCALCTLLPLVPWRGRVVLRALRPSLYRLLAVQAVAQPLTAAAMLVQREDGFRLAALAGAVATTAFAVLFLLRTRVRSQHP